MRLGQCPSIWTFFFGRHPLCSFVKYCKLYLGDYLLNENPTVLYQIRSFVELSLNNFSVLPKFKYVNLRSETVLLRK